MSFVNKVIDRVADQLIFSNRDITKVGNNRLFYIDLDYFICFALTLSISCLQVVDHTTHNFSSEGVAFVVDG